MECRDIQIDQTFSEQSTEPPHILILGISINDIPNLSVKLFLSKVFLNVDNFQWIPDQFSIISTKIFIWASLIE